MQRMMMRRFLSIVLRRCSSSSSTVQSIVLRRCSSSSSSATRSTKWGKFLYDETRRCSSSSSSTSATRSTKWGKFVYDETKVVDGWHVNPSTGSNESDMTQRTRMTLMSTEMLESKLMGIRSMSTRGFRLIDGLFLYGPIAIFPRTVLSWRVLTPDDITAESLELFVRLEPKLDILVLGVGDRKSIDPVRLRVTKRLQEHRIALEIMNTEDAVPIFNFLNLEGRAVAGALYPPDDFPVSSAEHARVLAMLKPPDIIDDYQSFGAMAAKMYENYPEVLISQLIDNCDPVELAKHIPDPKRKLESGQVEEKKKEPGQVEEKKRT